MTQHAPQHHPEDQSSADPAQVPEGRGGPRYSPEEIAQALDQPLPTPEQSAIIAADLSPRLVVAGAGSGKTATMVDRVVWLVVNGFVRPEEVLGVTFTTKAAAELRQRMIQRLQSLQEKGLWSDGEGTEAPALEPTVSTYHAYAKSLVGEYGLRIGVEKDAAQLGAAQSHQLVAQIVEHWDGPRPEAMPAASTLIQATLSLSGECAEHLRTPEEVEAECLALLEHLRSMPNGHPKRLKKAEKARNDAVTRLEQKVLVARLAQRYQLVKQRMQVMDFGDLLAYAATLAQDLPVVGAEQRELYKVVLLDEFQDTSHAQLVLFAALFGQGHSVMAVGDPKQSIYGFRGASEGQLFDFYRHFPSPDPRPSYLSVAWRNGTRILDAANAVARPLATPARWASSSAGIRVPDLEPRPEATPGRVHWGTWASEAEEAHDLVAGIAAAGARREAAGEEPLSTAILCRARSQMETVRLECEEQGVDYDLVGLGGLLDSPEVVDVLSVLRVLSDPTRSDALMRLLAGARWRIGPRDLLALQDWAGQLARDRRERVVSGLVSDGGPADGQGSGSQDDPAQVETARSPRTQRDEARKRLEGLLRGGGDPSDGSSLIEALEHLPAADWISPQGRAIGPVARERMARLAAELAELRGYLGEDLTTLLYHVERVSLLDLELASVPGRDVHAARSRLDAFYQAAADYCSSAPRMAATLSVGAAVRLEETTPESGEEAAGRVVLPPAEQVQEHRYTVTSSAAGVQAFLAWLETAAREENGLASPVGAPRPGAVQILTVHGSKGLEWDEVRLFGMAEGVFPTDQRDHWLKSAGALPWFMRGDAAHLPQWDTAVEDTQDLEETWARFQDANDERVVAEERRLAYVALTRAKDLVHAGSSWWAGTKAKVSRPSRFLQELADLQDREDPGFRRVMDAPAPPEDAANPQKARILAALWPFDPLTRPIVTAWDSARELDALTFTEDAGAEVLDPGPEISRRPQVVRAAALVQAALVRPQAALGASDQAAGTGDGTDGEGESVDIGSEEEIGSAVDGAASWERETELLLALRRRRREEIARFVPPRHVSASTVVGLSDDPQRVLRQLVRPMPRRPTVQARAGTRFHAWIEEHYGTAGMLDLDEVLDDGAEEDDPLAAADAAALRENFRGSRWYHQQPWAVEFPLETDLGGVRVRGRVDAIFRHEDQHGERWELVDWKTGRVPRGPELAHKAQQLAVYRLGFARLLDIDPERISACFYYVAHDVVVEPDGLADEGELERLVRRLGAQPGPAERSQA